MLINFEMLGIDYLLVNSTNEFLEEYSNLSENARYTVTKFTGSTGDALVAKSGEVYLFVDGRYHIQAEQEVDENVTLVKLQTGQKQDEEIKKLVPQNAVLGLVVDKNSQERVENFKKDVKVELLKLDPINFNTEINTAEIEFLPVELTGMSFEEKVKDIPKPYFIFNQEEVSYLLNARDFSKNYSSKIQGKLLLTEYENVLFTDMKVKNCPIENLAIMPLSAVRNILSMISYPVNLDKTTVSAGDYSAIMMAENIPSPVKSMKSVKTSAELEGYKKAFEATDKALLATRDFIMKNEASEFEIAEELEKNFKKFGAKSLSFKSIVAKDMNSALAHYSKSSKDEIVKDGSLVLIDCGAYFENGLATDITRVFVKGEPTLEHKKIYTTVLKMFLNAFNTEYKEDLNGYEVDQNARNLIKYNPVKDYTFGHGLGHGIGINVHEAPPNLSPAEIAKVTLKNGMCFTIEPGLYNPQTFGVRLENSCYFEDNKIKSFTRMPYESKLIDFELLNENEIECLKEFELI